MARKQKKDDDFSFDFSSFDFTSKTEEEAREVPRLSLEPACFENAEEMANALDYGKDYICFVSGTFIFGDFLEALVLVKELAPKQMYITTLGMGKENVDSIVNLTDYLGCEHLNLVVSHYFAGVERHDLVPYMEQEFAGKPIDVAVLKSHCKIALIRSDKGDVAITGSANLSSSTNVEQFIIAHDPTLIDFLEKRLKEIMDRFTVMHGLDGAKMDWKKYRKRTNKGWEAFTGEEE